MGKAGASYLIASVGPRRLAFDTREIAEVLPLLPMWRPPTLPQPLAGFVTIAGETLPVLDPLTLFGLAKRSGAVDLFAHLIRPRGSSARRPCLLVDHAEALVTPTADEVQPIEASASHDGLVSAQIVMAHGVAHLVSFDRLLSTGESEQVAALARQATARADSWADA